MTFTLEQSQRLQEIHALALRGEATREQLIEGVKLLRQDREGAQVGSTKAKTEKAAAKAPVDTQAALANLRQMALNLQGATHPDKEE